MNKKILREAARHGLFGGFARLHMLFEDYNNANQEDYNNANQRHHKYPEEVHGPGITTQDVITIGALALTAGLVYVATTLSQE